jgi:hypothetical protein
MKGTKCVSVPCRQTVSPDQGSPPIQELRISFPECSVLANRRKIYTEKAISLITIREEGADLDPFKAHRYHFDKHEKALCLPTGMYYAIRMLPKINNSRSLIS